MTPTRLRRIVAPSHDKIRSVSGARLDVFIELEDDESGDELRRLAQWLRSDEDLRDAKIVTEEAPGRPGDMGSGADVIQLVFESNGILVALVGVLGTWLGTRRRSIKIRVRAGKREIEIDGAQSGDAGELAARLIREIDGP